MTKCICVDRACHNGKVKEEAIAYLKKDEAIGLFSEEIRNRTDKELLTFEKGSVKMAQEVECPIVPFDVNGSFTFRSKNLIVRFGKPITVMRNDNIDEANNRLRHEILNMQNLNKKEVYYEK